MIKVSVIIPVYNVEPWLAACLDSVAGQTLRDIEIICINDGSRDGSRAILAEYAAGDARFILADQENGGQSTARNRGLDMARGEYVYFIDGDDILAKDALERLTQRADADKLDALFFDAETFAEDGESAIDGYSYIREKDYSGVYSGMELMAEFSRNGEYRPSPCLEIWRRDYIEKIGLRFIPNMIHEDNPFTFRALIYAPRAGHMPERFYKRRYRSGSTMTNAANPKHFIGWFISFVNMLDCRAEVHAPENIRPWIDKVVANVFFGAMREYNQLSPQQRAALDWGENAAYAGFFGGAAGGLWDMYQSEEALELRRAPYRDEALIEKLHGDIDARQRLIYSIEASGAFRLGRLVTLPLRAARSLKNRLQGITRRGDRK